MRALAQEDGSFTSWSSVGVERDSDWPTIV